MPADFLSRNVVVDSISFIEDKIRDVQMLDPRLQALKKLLYSNTLPQYNSEDFCFCKLYQNDSFIDNGILNRRLRRTGEPDRVVLFAPPNHERRHFAGSPWCCSIQTWRNLEDKRANSSKLFLARHGPGHSDTLENVSEVPVMKDKASFTVTVTSVYSTQPKN